MRYSFAPVGSRSKPLLRHSFVVHLYDPVVSVDGLRSLWVYEFTVTWLIIGFVCVQIFNQVKCKCNSEWLISFQIRGMKSKFSKLRISHTPFPSKMGFAYSCKDLIGFVWTNSMFMGENFHIWLYHFVF